MSNNKVTFIDLFAGIGGFRLGLESIGAKCVFSSEIDKFAQQTYEANFGEKPHGDITKIAAKDIPPHDILCAGFPCQSFSIAGKKKGFEDTRGTLFFEIARIAKYHKPKVLFLENVQGLLSHDKGKTFLIIFTTLEDLGYIVHYKVLNSKNFGVPQNRKRVFIVAFLNDVDFKFPKPSNQVTCIVDILETDVDEKYFISEKAWLGHQKRKAKNMALGKGFGYKLVTHESLETSTLTSHYSKGGTEILLKENTSNRPRKLTPRECARLQGFPDSFKIVCSDTQAYKQFGNAVTVNVITAIAKQILIFLLSNSEKPNL